nr:peptide chain release factor N(5)-glutamine methyltransferase [uncultured Glaciecola sp.]
MASTRNRLKHDVASETQASDLSARINLCQTITDALSASRKVLTEHQENLTFNDPTIEAKIFIEYAFEKTSMQLITQSGELLCEDGKKKLISTLSKRIYGYPVAYIVGFQPFWTLNLRVSEHTLIPRSDSEIVVETAIGLPLSKDANVLDLGTGTGAIALAIKSERSHWIVSGCDFKEEIIELARANASLNSLNVEFVLSNWFSGITATQAFDLIVSNPPYVESNSIWLNQGDVRFEPDSALTSGIDGLDDIRHIISKGTEYLKSGGYLLLEHGHQQANVIQQLLLQQGYQEVTTKQDLNGLDRATLGRWLV